MASYTAIDTNSLLPGEPVTSSIMLALEENPRAIAEQASGAPKLAAAFVNGQVASGGALTFSGMADFSGIIAYGTAIRTGASDDVTFSFSSDGSTYSTPFVISAVAASADSPFVFVFDFSTGEWQTQRDSGTDGAASLAITHVRFDSVGSDIDVLLNPQGGIV